MINKKIVHIHSDAKFVQEIYLYSKNNFENQLVFLGDKTKLPNRLEDSAIFLEVKNKKNFSLLLKVCKDANIVILNNLTYTTINLALNLPPQCIIIWRFFGSEIYSRHPDLIYSKTSLQTWTPPEKKLSFLNQIKFRISKTLQLDRKFLPALDRIDYFMGLMDDEYLHLRKLGYNLPPFRQVPLLNYTSSDVQFDKRNQIIFGNSRNRGNNHLDILQILKDSNLPSDLEIKMFFSYGGNGPYATEVRKMCKPVQQIKIIEKFLSGDEFYSIYESASALIINSYRQMAMGNIFTAIAMGVKVYLSEKNVAYSWFIKNGIKVFCIEKDLAKDLITSNYILDTVETQTNIKNLSTYFDNCSIDQHIDWLDKISSSSINLSTSTTDI